MQPIDNIGGLLVPIATVRSEEYGCTIVADKNNSVGTRIYVSDAADADNHLTVLDAGEWVKSSDGYTGTIYAASDDGSTPVKVRRVIWKKGGEAQRTVSGIVAQVPDTSEPEPEPGVNPELLFQTSFPSSTTMVDDGPNGINIGLLSGAVVNSGGTEFADNLASIDSASTNGSFFVSNHESLNFESDPWTVEMIVNHAAEPTANIAYMTKYQTSGERQMWLGLDDVSLRLGVGANGSVINNVYSQSVDIVPGVDHHIVWQGDGAGNGSIYFDGNRVYNGLLGSFPIFTTNEPLRFGYYFSGSYSNLFKGRYKWVAISGKAVYDGETIDVPTIAYTLT